jgi:hypothetical protein
VGLERGPLSLVSTIEGSYLEEKVVAPVYKTENTAIGMSHNTLYLQKIGTNFTDKRRSLGRYSSLADWDHVV